MRAGDCPDLEVVNVGLKVIVFLQDLFECLQTGADTQAGVEISDVVSPEGRATDGVVVGQHRAAQSVQLVLEHPVGRQTEGVDQAVSSEERLQERVQADKLGSVHLLVLPGGSNKPGTTKSLQSPSKSTMSVSQSVRVVTCESDLQTLCKGRARVWKNNVLASLFDNLSPESSLDRFRFKILVTRDFS